MNMNEEIGNDFEFFIGKDNSVVIQKRSETGEGVMTMYEVMPGIQIMFNDFHLSELKSNFSSDKELFCVFMQFSLKYLSAKLQDGIGYELVCRDKLLNGIKVIKTFIKKSSSFPRFRNSVKNYYAMTLSWKMDMNSTSVPFSLVFIKFSVTTSFSRSCYFFVFMVLYIHIIIFVITFIFFSEIS